MGLGLAGRPRLPGRCPWPGKCARLAVPRGRRLVDVLRRWCRCLAVGGRRGRLHVAAIAPSEEVLGRPRHRALGGRCRRPGRGRRAARRTRRRRRTARRSADRWDGPRNRRRACGASGGEARVWRCGAARFVGSNELPLSSQITPTRFYPPSRQLFSFFSELVSGHENIEPSARRWTKPAPPALKTPRSRVMPNPTATFNTSEVRSRHA